MRAWNMGRLVNGVAAGALVLMASAMPAVAQYNTAGSEKAATPAVVAAVSSATASITAGGISSAISGGGGFVSAGAATANLRRYGSGDSGLGAAGSDKKFGLWINGGWNHMKNDFVNTKFDGDSYIGALGGDFKINDRLTIGVTASFEDTDLSTNFNSGTVKTKGIGVGPYAAYILSPNFYVDAFATFSRLDTDVTRTSGSIRGSYDSDRWTGVANLNGQFALTGSWRVYPQVGVLYVHQKDEAYRESGASTSVVGVNYVSLGQARGGAKVGYDFGRVEPYFGARYQYNFVNPEVNLGTVASPSNDRDSVNFQGGIKFKLTNTLTGSLEGNTTQFLKDTEQYGALGSIKLSF